MKSERQDAAIIVTGVSKEYRIGARRERHRTLRDAIAKGWRRSEAEIRAERKFWAVKDVSFEVRPGEVFGIIGRNGAGKSTLLKLLARVTQPTAGRMEIRGTLGALLEVGTGFHPELTGAENVYLSGAIQGMKRAEIRARFDEIVEFAEIERFLHTPVKRYSSGMYMRLAFAVAAHTRPDVLVVDEVLAVGDARFQVKCLGKMGDVARAGRTVVFVSHDMAAVTRLCTRALRLDGGVVVEEGGPVDVVRHYLRSDLGTTAERAWGDAASAPGDEVVRLRAVRVAEPSGRTVDAVEIGGPFRIVIDYELLDGGGPLLPCLHFVSEDGTCLFVSQCFDSVARDDLKPGMLRSTAEVPGNLLAEGGVSVHVAISTRQKCHVFERDVVAFQGVERVSPNATRGWYAGPIPGVVRPLLAWRTEWVDRA